MTRPGRSVLLVIADLGSGGAQQVLRQLAGHWVTQGYRVGVLTLAAPGDDFFKLDDRVERLSIGGVCDSQGLLQAIAQNTSRVLHLRRAIREFAPDVAISFIAPMNILTIIATFGLGAEVVISERNDPARQSFGRVWDGLRRMLYRFADVVSANNNAAIVALGAYVPRSKLVYLPNPLRQTAQSVAEAAGERIILNVGRLHEQKGQDILIRAFANAGRELDGWRICIVGEGQERTRLRTLADSLGLSDRVELIGRVEDPFFWYRRASIFAFPSRWEGTPNALIEAMSCGLPVVVNGAAQSVLELVRHEDNGLVASEADFGAALIRLVKDEDFRRKLGRAGMNATRQFAPPAAFAAWDAAIWSNV
jgi:glycosyltransferase involved in cell wall biosynthesis